MQGWLLRLAQLVRFMALCKLGPTCDNLALLSGTNPPGSPTWRARRTE